MYFFRDHSLQRASRRSLFSRHKARALLKHSLFERAQPGKKAEITLQSFHLREKRINKLITALCDDGVRRSLSQAGRRRPKKRPSLKHSCLMTWLSNLLTIRSKRSLSSLSCRARKTFSPQIYDQDELPPTQLYLLCYSHSGDSREQISLSPGDEWSLALSLASQSL